MVWMNVNVIAVYKLIGGSIPRQQERLLQRGSLETVILPKALRLLIQTTALCPPASSTYLAVKNNPYLGVQASTGTRYDIPFMVKECWPTQRHDTPLDDHC